MPREDLVFLTPKGRNLRSRPVREEDLESGVWSQQVDLEIVLFLLEHGPTPAIQIVEELSGPTEYRDRSGTHPIEVYPSSVRDSMRRLFEAGYLERID